MKKELEMVVWRNLKALVSALCAVSLVILSGCAQNPAAPAEAVQHTAMEDKKAEKALAATMAPGEEVVPDYTVMNPVPIVFEKMSIKLRDSDKQLLAQIKERAQKARTVTITGYCDRKQVGNAKAAALARAQSVKDELVRLGVKPKVFRIKHITDVANKHAVEIELKATT